MYSRGIWTSTHRYRVINTPSETREGTSLSNPDDLKVIQSRKWRLKDSFEELMCWRWRHTPAHIEPPQQTVEDLNEISNQSLADQTETLVDTYYRKYQLYRISPRKLMNKWRAAAVTSTTKLTMTTSLCMGAREWRDHRGTSDFQSYHINTT